MASGSTLIVPGSVLNGYCFGKILQTRGFSTIILTRNASEPLETGSRVAVRVYEKNLAGGKEKADVDAEIEVLKLLTMDNETSSLFEKVHFYFEDDYRYYIGLNYAKHGYLLPYFRRAKNIITRGKIALSWTIGEMAKFYMTELIFAIGHLQSRGISFELESNNLVLSDDWHLLLTSVGAVKDYNAQPSWAQPSLWVQLGSIFYKMLSSKPAAQSNVGVPLDCSGAFFSETIGAKDFISNLMLGLKPEPEKLDFFKDWIQPNEPTGPKNSPIRELLKTLTDNESFNPAPSSIPLTTNPQNPSAVGPIRVKTVPRNQAAPYKSQNPAHNVVQQQMVPLQLPPQPLQNQAQQAVQQQIQQQPCTQPKFPTPPDLALLQQTRTVPRLPLLYGARSSKVNTCVSAEDVLDEVGIEVTMGTQYFVSIGAPGIQIGPNDYDEALDLKLIRHWVQTHTGPGQFFSATTSDALAAICWVLYMRNTVAHHLLEKAVKYFRKYLTGVIWLFGPSMINYVPAVTKARDALDEEGLKPEDSLPPS